MILDDIQNIVYLYQDGANTLYLSDTIIDELDKKKELMNEMGYFVREFFRNLYTPEDSNTAIESKQSKPLDSSQSTLSTHSDNENTESSTSIHKPLGSNEVLDSKKSPVCARSVSIEDLLPASGKQFSQSENTESSSVYRKGISPSGVPDALTPSDTLDSKKSSVCSRSGASEDLLLASGKQFSQSENCNEHNDYIRQIYFLHNSRHIPITLIYRPHYDIPYEERSLNDTKIIAIAKDYNLTLLTNDISLKIRALTQNLNAQSLFRDRVENPEKIDFWQSFEIHKDENLSSLEANERFGKLKNWSLLELIELDNTDSSMYRTGKKSFGFKVNGKCEIANLDEMIEENKPYITPANLEQKMLYAMLLHPKNLISIVTGATGSGKTLIALQAGLSLLKNGDVEGIIYLRNTVTATDKEAELGFRKGDESQKLSYFMYPLYSAINCMIDKLQQGSLAKRIEYRGEVKSIEKMEATEYFLQKHKIEVLDIAHARGITIANKFIIFDEVQNASNATIKLIGTRVGEGSRIVFLGDWAQIDHPYLSKFRNGALSLLQKAVSDDMIAAMQLRQTIRSDIARWFGDFE